MVIADAVSMSKQYQRCFSISAIDSTGVVSAIVCLTFTGLCSHSTGESLGSDVLSSVLLRAMLHAVSYDFLVRFMQIQTHSTSLTVTSCFYNFVSLQLPVIS